MANLFGLRKPNTNLRKNVFDLSHKSLYTQSAGMLLPVFAKEVNPGEKVEFNLSALVRTMPLNSAGFIRCRQYYHVFFVPFKQLWNGWDNFINGVDYKQSALQDNKTYTKVPTIGFFAMIRKLLENGLIVDDLKLSGKVEKSHLDEHGFEYYRGISRLLDMLGYGFSVDLERVKKGYSALYDVIKKELYIDKISSFAEFIDVQLGLWKYVNTDVPYGRVENYTGYLPGDYLPGDGGPTPEELAEYREYKRKLKAGLVNPATEEDAGLFATQPTPKVTKQEIKSWAMSELNDLVNKHEFRVNIFRLLAYQKIYNDFYKRDEYEATDPKAFNIDDISSDSGFDSISPDRLLSILRLRYRWLPKDYFTGVVPSELDQMRGYLSSNPNVGSSIEVNYDEIWNSSDPSDPVTTKSIRAMFAIEKLLRLTRRAGGYDYISQTAAHYGVDVPEGRGDKVDFIGGYSLNVDINEVITTSSSQEELAGQTYGRGIGASSDNKDTRYTAKEHGVIMVVSSFVPDLDYNGYGLDRFNSKAERGDYFHPELSELGLQPVYGYELDNNRTLEQKNVVLGYGPAYGEYKTSYDKLHGEFRNGREFAAWSGSQLVGYEATKKLSGLRINTLKINPKSLDRVFTAMFDGSEKSDQFLVSTQFFCKIIRPMSITGQNL